MNAPSATLRRCTTALLIAGAAGVLAAADGATPAAFGAASDTGGLAADAAAVTPTANAAADPAAALRALPRASRHALIIGVGKYLNPAIPELKGIVYDVESATQMALAMQVPKENIRVLRDTDATAATIEREIAELNARTQPGDRVFFYFSGHGSRWYDAAVNKNGCVEALLPSDGLPLTNERIATILKPISDKTDKLFVFYDACHSGGIVDRPLATMRSLKAPGGTLTPKFTSVGTAEQCSRPANMKTRAFTTEAIRTGGLPQNIVQISSSRPDEVSFDDDRAGGLATQAWRDCMLGESRDLDHSGSISVGEIAVCAQARIDKRFANSAQFAAQHVTLGGNAAFIPSWFSSAFVSAPAGGATAGGTSTVNAALVSTTSAGAATAGAAGGAAVAAAAGKPVAAVNAVGANTVTPPDAAFADILAQRDPRRRVDIGAGSHVLKIGRDTLDLTVTSSHAGHVYLVLLGSDNESFYLLFPNDKDHDNAIKAGETLRLPRPDWKITAQGPAGIDRMLAVVTESPRNLSLLGTGKSGPFLQALTDSSGRANLSWILSTAMHQAATECQSGGKARSDGVVSKCSDAFGAAMTSVVEK